jgi:hypothetical protein
MNQDATSLVFMSEEEFQGFDGTEIKKLSQKKTALAEEKLRLQQTVILPSDIFVFHPSLSPYST